MDNLHLAAPCRNVPVTFTLDRSNVPTILSHPAVPLAVGLGLGAAVIPRRLLIAGIFASIAPDFDVLAFRLGVAYSHAAGHRGITHSLLFAVLAGAIALAFSRQLGARRSTSFWFVFISALSHPLLDMLTNGGLGVALFWPASDTRLFFPVHPIEVSPLSVRRVFGEAGARVFSSEFLWVWIPALITLGTLRVMRRRHAV